MGGTWGNHIKLSIFGESHSNAIGIVIDGLPSGVALDLDEIAVQMGRRKPGTNGFSTPRREEDLPEIVSGLFNGKTTGTPLCAVIRNNNTNSSDYEKLRDCMRPGHADYTGMVKYNGFQDYRGGGHFSGRLTAPLVFAGSICRQILRAHGIFIGAHINSIHQTEDRRFAPEDLTEERFAVLRDQVIPVLEKSARQPMEEKILAAKSELDSVGGTIECAVIGLPAGIGDPFFDSVESVLSHLIFSVPAVKGLEFGAGFSIAQMRGSQANDAWCYGDDGKVSTKTNHNGGILGGISNGMPIVFRVAIKPTPSIAQPQQTINVHTKENVTLEVQGRHDPCILPRAVPVLESVTAIGIYDLLKGSGKVE